MAIFSYGPPPPPYNTPPQSRTPSRAPSRSRELNIMPIRSRNRSLSVRSRKDTVSSTGGASTVSDKPAAKHRFTMASLRGLQQPDLSKRLFKLIKSENHAITAYETAGRERSAIATQLSEWGDDTGDDAISDISDKLGVLLAEIAEQEDVFAQNLEEYRGVLKQIRNTESSVQPSRDHKAKVSDEIQKLKYKDPTNTKIVQLEQELVRAEAQSLVAEAQLINITRQKLKEAFDIHTAATVERAEKQILLAKRARRLVNLLDDTPIVPGDVHQPFAGAEAARAVLADAEDDLRAWRPSLEPIHSGAGALGAGGVVTSSPTSVVGTDAGHTEAGYEMVDAREELVHPAYRKGSRSSSGRATPHRRVTSGGSTVGSEVGESTA